MNHLSTDPSSREALSALADNELGSADVAAVLQSCAQEEGAALGRWNYYQMIGELLRAPGGPAAAADPAFLSRVRQSLADQPAFAAAAAPVPVPVPVPVLSSALTTSVIEPIDNPRPASNDSSFRWKLAAGFASLAMLVAVSWQVIGLPTAPGQVLAQGPVALPQPIIAASPQGLMVRDARLEQLLAAHRQLGGASALFVPPGFVQNALFQQVRSDGR